MPAPIWKPGTLYLPGDLVQPASVQPATSSNVANGDFSGGAAGWDFTGGVAYTTDNSYDGPGHYCNVPGGAASGEALNQTQIPTAAGESITATCRIQQGASDVDHTRGLVILRWYDAGGVQIGSDDLGNVVNDGRDGAWHESTVTAVAPIGASYARAGIGLYQDSNDAVFGDDLVVTGTYRIPADALFYRAVQPAAGVSAASEPAWPQSLGVQVIDNEVIWEAVLASRVTWIASPIAESGGIEPNWPTQPGAVVNDGTVQWECITRAVEDENCPNTKVVAIMAGKVFAADGDITRFSATANPLDWTSENDAGYLPTGMNQANANDMAVLAPYRGNLGCFNANGFQLYQVDPDPAAMAQLDQMEGVGSTWTLAAQAVANDLLYLSQQGVRSVGIANAAENLAAGDVGSPIDVLVRDAVRVAVANDNKIHSTYYPGAGQYWLTFCDYPAPPLSIAGDLPDGIVSDSGTYQYTASGGVLPYGDFSIVSGELPTGATMDASGLVTYEYVVSGNYAWTVQLLDADGNPALLDDTAEVVAAATFATDTYHYTGPATSLTKGANPIPWASGVVIDVVSLSPNGQYLVGADSGSLHANRFQMFKYVEATDTWAALALPASVPAAGPLSFSWSADGTYLAVGVNSGADIALVYKRTGDTFTRLAAPSPIQSGQSTYVKWSPDGLMLACGSSSTGDNLWVYDFDPATDTFSGGRGGVTTTGDQTAAIAFVPGTDNRYIVRGNSKLNLIDTSGASLAIVSTPVMTDRPDATAGAYFLNDTDFATVGAVQGAAAGPVAVWRVTGATISFVEQPAAQPTVGAARRASLSTGRSRLAIARDIAGSPDVYVYANVDGALTASGDFPTAAAQARAAAWRDEQ